MNYKYNIVHSINVNPLLKIIYSPNQCDHLSNAVLICYKRITISSPADENESTCLNF